ncbi:hypothetical protein BDV96DRAFT_487146 [Lophiotrema nucula]|uniref:UBC core domain-containing protein n=1 Tax=Lophiotrema nucula TaxID=690887 RepID=A0A6A5ZJB3_9PLEO|nr:hypothetical protein BDV96DRAFT_487146 [Lophiotrema nucula]
MDDDSNENPDTTPPEESTDRERQATWFERWLAQLFEDRFLWPPHLDDASTEATPSRHERPPPPSALYTYARHVPYFSAASTVAAMDGEQVPFCVEDSVGLKDDKFMVGVVDRTFGDVDSHEPRPQRDYGEDIERHRDVPKEDFGAFMKTGIPPRGTVLVSWQSELKTELIPEAQLKLLDRALYVGDVVKRSAKDHISGTVIGSRAVCTLLPLSMRDDTQRNPAAADDVSVKAVPAEELLHVHEYNEGALVIYKDWVGKVEQVYDEVAVRLPNNSVVIVETPDDLEPDDPDVDRLSVGDTVRTKKGNLRRGRWKYGAFNPNVQPKGTVVEARTVSLNVHWLARRFISSESVPADHIEPPSDLYTDELESADFHVYDAARGTPTVLPTSPNDIDKSYHVAELAVGDRVKFKDLTAAAVKYDGTRSLPNGYPVGKLKRIPRTETLGYDMNVFLVMQTHTQVTVQWQDLTITEDMSQTLIPDPNVGDDDEVWPGEIVCSVEQRQGHDPTTSWLTEPAKVGVVQSVKSRDRIATVRWFETFNVRFAGEDLIPPVETGRLLDATEDVSLYDIRSTPSLNRRRGDFVLIHPDSALYKINGELASTTNAINWFGEVLDLGLDGLITVRLGAALPVIDVRVRIERVTLVYSSDMDNQFDFMPTLDGESIEDDEDSEDDSEFDTDSFNEMWVDMNGEPIGATEDEDWSTEEEDADDDDVSMPDLIPQENIDTSKTTPEAHSDNERKESPLILRNSLPPGIYVRTWESRLDLIRVLMIGPSDTPYEYAPFIIDFYLDSSYPSQAPEAFFHSWTEGNGPVNPNLYEDGKICLSLLGTWHADERNESWSPGKSTLLQVLVSIMGLVLVKEPYYNEAGYDVHRSAPETKLSSALYTERAYFKARAFIAHALAPKLLDKAIVAATSILERSEQGSDEEERDGMNKISLGAVVMLKRQVAKLEALKAKAT